LKKHLYTLHSEGYATHELIARNRITCWILSF